MKRSSGSIRLNSWATILLLASAPSVNAFTSAIFQESVTAQRTAPSKIEGVEIELPNFDELFGRIQQVSPLARVAMQRAQTHDKKGFVAADYDSKYLCVLIAHITTRPYSLFQPPTLSNRISRFEVEDYRVKQEQSCPPH